MTNRTAVRALICVTVSVMLGSSRPIAQGTDPAAWAAAESWVALIDQEQYAASWQTAASSFKNAVPQQKWTEAVRVARGPFGGLKSRTVKSSTATKTLPGAADGQYVVLQFSTTFEKKAAAVETITMLYDPDGQWRVVGYFVR
jgi:Protein of unknown function (DUF4019)